MSNIKELQIKGFVILYRVYQSTNSLVYRAIRTADNRYVILKTSFSDRPSLEEIAALQHEYKLLKKLKLPGVIQAIDMIKYNQQVILVLNDIEGETLQEYLASNAISLKKFFKITLQLSDILSGLQENRIIHKDIKPNSIIIQPKDLNVELIDFNIASVHTQGESQENVFPNALEGSLPYMSPEQTGRMNRNIDYRSDLYSLGITMFEMLTGQLPFQANDPLEWVHAHLAKQPDDVRKLNPEVPEQVANIINKLLAKTPEERYSSAESLKMDLLTCEKQWLKDKKITLFPLDQYQLNDQLQISQKLYGREQQIKELDEAFETIAQGRSELVLVTGQSGIGKTSLIKEIHKPVVRQHGYYISGKFDQLQRYVPYSAIIKAFQELIRQVLIEPDYKLATIKNNLQNALQHNAQIIIELIPDLELIIGKQPAVTKVNPVEEQRRLLKVFQQFVEVFAQSDHPLVIFIDDLQWADSGSLGLLEALLKDPDLHYLLVIGAYRINEVDKTHPLMMMLDNLERDNISYKNLLLESLSLQDVNALLADTFKLSKEKVASLATLINDKTQGNPFFINEFLKNLYRDNYIYFSYTDKTWNWHIDTISALPVTNNVVDMLVNDIKKLPFTSQSVLKFASCIGFTFSLTTLATISKETIAITLERLKLAIEENFVHPLDNNYKSLLADASFIDESTRLSLAKKSHYRFTHDRIHQAAYELIPEDQKEKTHLEIGRLLFKEKELMSSEEGLFEVVSHFNRSLSLITDKNERKDIATLNLHAGKRSKASIAYEIAIDYFSSGARLLSEENWRDNHELTFDLYLELAECEYLNGKLSEAQEHFRLLLSKANTVLERAKVYRIKADLYTIRGKFQEAISVSIEALQMFNINLPMKPSIFDLLKQIIKIRFMLGFGKIDTLEARMKPITNPESLMIDILLNNVVNSAYFYNKKVLALAFFTAMILNIKNGYSQYSSAIFNGCGFIFITRFNKFDLGFKLLEIGKHFEEKFDNKSAIALSHMGIGIFLNHWRSHSLQSIEHLKRSYQAGLESGEIIPMVYSRSSIPYMLFYSRPLPQVAQDIEIALPLLRKLDTEAPYDSQLILKFVVQALRNHPCDIDEAKAKAIFADIIESKNNNYVCLAATFLSRYYLIMDDIPHATQMIEKAFSLAEYHEGALNFTQGYIIHAICLASAIPNMKLIPRLLAWRRLKKIRNKLAKWTKQCAVNFEHGYYLVCAEIARLQDKHDDAEDFYNKAIDTAQADDYIFYVALAHERTARYFLSRKKTRYVKLHFMEALYSYMRWGANNKCKLLQKNFGEYLKVPEEGQDQTKKIITITTSKASMLSLDYMALVKSMQALSSEIQLEQLLKKLVHIVLEHAGAKRCVILVKQGENWLVEAEGNLTKERINLNNSEMMDTRKDIPLSVIHYAQRTLKPAVIQDATISNEFSKDPYLKQVSVRSLLALPILYQGQLRRILYLENDSASNAFTTQHIESMQLLISQAAISLENAKFYHASNRFVPYAFLQRLNRESLVDVKIGDQMQRKMSILFCDIQGFTTLSETLPANEIFKFVSEFLGGMEPIISRFNGFIDKYIGDAVMALFDNADDALQAAIAMHFFQKRFNQSYVHTGRQPVGMGIGVNTGDLILGMVGNAQRMDCSVIGDSVNIASRVESLTRSYKVPILITEETRINLKNSINYQLRLISGVSVKGKAKPIDVWAVEVDAGLPKETTPSIEAKTTLK